MKLTSDHPYWLINSGLVNIYPKLEKSVKTDTNFDTFANHILARLNTKGYTVKDIIDEILALGFNGCRTHIYHYINIIKNQCKINIPDFTELQQTSIPYVKPLSSGKLAKYIVVCIKRWIDFIRHSKRKLSGLKTFANGLF